MNQLIIFIKNPQLGKVKTRLAASIGADAALAIYHKLCQHTRQTVLGVEVERQLYYSDYIDRHDDWREELFVKHQQVGPDLGARMNHAFQDSLKRGNKAVIIGSDCPQLTADLIQDAFHALAEHPFVLGPAKDGGYYLLGMSEPYPELFHNIEWSTNKVAEMTLQRIHAKTKSCLLLPTLSDIDTIEDWEKWGW
jgi:uncharacterized protein